MPTKPTATSIPGQSVHDEQWKPIGGWEGYYDVSGFGRVRLARDSRTAPKGHILCQAKQNGYLAVTLARNGTKRKVAVHILVAQAFLGPMPVPGMEVNHKDTDKHNNDHRNLEWTTSLENVRHAIANGLVGGRAMPGEENGRSKLTASQVVEIRRLRGSVSQRALAARFGVCKSTIQWVQNGRNWSRA